MSWQRPRRIASWKEGPHAHEHHLLGAGTPQCPWVGKTSGPCEMEGVVSGTNERYCHLFPSEPSLGEGRGHPKAPGGDFYHQSAATPPWTRIPSYYYKDVPSFLNLSKFHKGRTLFIAVPWPLGWSRELDKYGLNEWQGGKSNELGCSTPGFQGSRGTSRSASWA